MSGAYWPAAPRPEVCTCPCAARHRDGICTVEVEVKELRIHRGQSYEVGVCSACHEANQVRL